jgi:fibronectin-binding autotransporter adhesin
MIWNSIINGGLKNTGNNLNLLAQTGSIIIENVLGGITISGSSTQIQGVDFIPFSASLNTRILAITGSGGTIDTGSFATTGSNTFIGNQIVEGNLRITGSAGTTNALVLTRPGGGDTLRIGVDESNPDTYAISLSGSVNQTMWLIDNRGGVRYNTFTEGVIIANNKTLEVEGTFTASLQQGYAWVGNSAGKTTAVPTSSFGGGGTLPAGVLSSSVTNFVDYSSSVDSRINSIVTGTGFATTGSNTFTGNQTISTAGNTQLNLIAQPGFQTNVEFQSENSNFNAYGDFNIINNGQFGGSGSIKMLTKNNFMEFAADQGFRMGVMNTVGNGIEGGFVTMNVPSGSQQLQLTGSLAVGGNVNITGQYLVNGVPISGSGGTAFENPSVESISGSLLLTANTFTSGAASINHLSASAGGKVNLIFKNNNNAADTIISGSNNIFTNPAAPTAGFKRYLGNNNIALFGSPQISASMQWSPTINGNYFGASNPISIRGAVSASLMQINQNVLVGTLNIGNTAVNNAERLTGLTNVSSNVVGGTFNIVANQSDIRSITNINNNNINGNVTLNLSSSAVAMSQNTINDSNLSVTNQFSSGSLGFGQVSIGQNTIAGSGNTLIATGSQTVASTTLAGFNQNLLLGAANTAFVNSSESRISGSNIYHQLLATSLLGQRLIVTGSSNTNDQASFGSVFVGRFNASDGIRDKSSDVIFAVGTGTSGSADTRKTGFLIDSGSNTFVEGTLNVSGSTTITGSLNVSNVLQLGQLDPLPTGADGQLAVSASNLYFYSGSAWNKIAFG